ncbi:ribosomal protein S27AE [Streptacidiphilus sp. BW17]|uniref:hypothetical protein n=1 Tax=Streptacidiphilus sp. BW17 TaxID=3156274 RepID=UPI003514F524
MADSYRYRCGECGYRTPWGHQSQGERGIASHYEKRHPYLDPGGIVEYRQGSSGCGAGCLVAVGILVLLLVIAAATQH